jgi:hypothetical protein
LDSLVRRGLSLGGQLVEPGGQLPLERRLRSLRRQRVRLRRRRRVGWQTGAAGQQEARQLSVQLVGRLGAAGEALAIAARGL